MFAIV
jgi:Na+-driven multidrug efflux pump